MKFALPLALSLLLMSGAHAADLPADKVQAIHELTETMHMKELAPMVAKQTAVAMHASLEKVMNDAVDRSSLSDDAKQAAHDKLKTDLPEMLKAADTAMAKFDFVGYMNDVMTEVYGKYFEVSEIRDITAFYHTPTGQKLLATMPKAMPEILQLAMKRMQPIMGEIVDAAAQRWSKDQQLQGQ